MEYYSPSASLVLWWIDSATVVNVEGWGRGVFTAYTVDGWQFTKENGEIVNEKYLTVFIEVIE